MLPPQPPTTPRSPRESVGEGDAIAAAAVTSSQAEDSTSPMTRTIAAHEGPWSDGLGAASPWAGLGRYCFNLPDNLPAAVAPRVLVGSVLHATALHLLHSLGVTVVINCASGDCKVPVAEYAAAGIEYHTIQARDAPDYPLLSQHYPTIHAILKPVFEGRGRALVHCVAGRNRSATLAIAAVMLHERATLRSVARRCFLRRPFILTNPSFRSQLVDLARHHGLLGGSGGTEATPAPAPSDAGCSSELLCPHCMQPHLVSLLARADGRLIVDVRTFTVGALLRLLQRRFGCEHLNVDYETESSARDAAPPSERALLPRAALVLPLIPFGLIALADLPVPIGGSRDLPVPIGGSRGGREPHATATAAPTVTGEPHATATAALTVTAALVDCRLDAADATTDAACVTGSDAGAHGSNGGVAAVRGPSERACEERECEELVCEERGGQQHQDPAAVALPEACASANPPPPPPLPSTVSSPSPKYGNRVPGWASTVSPPSPRLQPPVGLLTIFDTKRKCITCVSVHDRPGCRGGELSLSLDLIWPMGRAKAAQPQGKVRANVRGSSMASAHASNVEQQQVQLQVGGPQVGVPVGPPHVR